MVFYSLPRNDFSVSNSPEFEVKSIDLLNTELHSYMISENVRLMFAKILFL